MFTSASTLVFKTFACDDAIGDEMSYLRADYSISCKSGLHTFFKSYAMLMILVRRLEREKQLCGYVLISCIFFCDCGWVVFVGQTPVGGTVPPASFNSIAVPPVSLHLSAVSPALFNSSGCT